MTVAEFIEENNIPSTKTIKLFNPYIQDYEAVGAPYSKMVGELAYCKIKGVHYAEELNVKSHDDSDTIILII